MPTSSSARDRLVAATITLMRERGVHGTGVAEVLKRSGAARGSIYQHFPGGKADLVAAATEVAGGLASRHVAQTSDGSPVAVVDAVVDWWVATLVKHDFGRGCPVAAAALDETAKVNDTAGRVFADWADQLGRTLHRADPVRFPADEARGFAGFVISALEGALLQCRALHSTQPLEDARAMLTRLVA